MNDVPLCKIKITPTRLIQDHSRVLLERILHNKTYYVAPFTEKSYQQLEPFRVSAFPETFTEPSPIQVIKKKLFSESRFCLCEASLDVLCCVINFLRKN